MPRLKIYHSILALGLLAGLSSCDKDFEEVNTNPNASTSANPDLLFSQAILKGNYVLDRAYFYTSYLGASMYIQHFANYKDASLAGMGDKYGVNDLYQGFYFTYLYPNVLENLRQCMEGAQKAGHVNKVATARIWRVLHFQRLTDLYGDVPYKNALKGYPENEFLPSYDPQSEIYDGLLNELEQAINSFQNGAPTFGAADFIYQGDIPKWKKFGYSLMLRLAMRMTKIDENKARTWAQKAITGGVIENAADIATVKYFNTGQVYNFNPVAYEIGAQDYKADAYGDANVEGGKFSKTFIDFLRNNNDPRLPVMAVTYNGTTADTTSSIAKGLPNGTLNKPNNFKTYSEPNPNTILRYDAPLLVITNAEMSFLLAEAALRGWTNANTASAYFKNGIENNMRNWAKFGTAGVIPEPRIKDYTDAHPLNTGAGFNAQMEQIHSQFWVALLLDELECYANWRRTGYPALTPTNAPGNQTNGVIPRRFPYLQTERSNNKAAYDAALARQGADNLLTRVWWDKQ